MARAFALKAPIYDTTGKAAQGAKKADKE